MPLPTISPVTVTRAEANAALEAGFARGAELGIPFTIAVLDGGGNIVAQAKEDGAALASVGTSFAKAVTAVHFAQPTQALQGATAPGAPLYGLGSRDAVYAFVGGGVPIANAAGTIIGAIGVGGGSPADDHQVASAAAAALA
jgi:uncharacterized protein GlcG (DUF336 family)